MNLRSSARAAQTRVTRLHVAPRWRKCFQTCAVQAFLWAIALCIVIPFLWMLLGSFKGLRESNQFPPTLVPRLWHPDNYLTAWMLPPGTLGHYLVNSLIVATFGTAGQLLLAVLAAFAFARLTFAGRDTLFLLVIATTLIPSEITTIPNFITIRHLPLAGGNNWMGVGGTGLYDTYAAMLLPGLANAFTIFLLRQSFLRVPTAYWDAARLEGASNATYLWRILVPLTAPQLAALALFGFIGRWNALLWPLLVTRDERLRTAQLGMLAYRQSETLTHFGVLMAGAVLVTLPIVLLFLLVQRCFRHDLGATGLYG